jgi:hypothetical protein
MRAGDGEGAHHRLPGVYVRGAVILMSAEASTHPARKSSLNSLGRPECPALRVIGPGDAIGVLLGHGHEVPLVEGLVTSAVGLDVRGFHDCSLAALPSMTRSWSAALLAGPFGRLSRPFRILAVTTGKDS